MALKLERKMVAPGGDTEVSKGSVSKLLSKFNSPGSGQLYGGSVQQVSKPLSSVSSVAAIQNHLPERGAIKELKSFQITLSLDKKAAETITPSAGNSRSQFVPEKKTAVSIIPDSVNHSTNLQSLKQRQHLEPLNNTSVLDRKPADLSLPSSKLLSKNQENKISGKTSLFEKKTAEVLTTALSTQLKNQDISSLKKKEVLTPALSIPSKNQDIRPVNKTFVIEKKPAVQINSAPSNPFSNYQSASQTTASASGKEKLIEVLKNSAPLKDYQQTLSLSKPIPAKAVEGDKEMLNTTSMAPTATDKYSHSSLDVLNKLLKESKDFEERRALRAAIRKVKEARNNEAQRESSSSTDMLGDLTKHTEEDLQLMAQQTTSLEERRRIRAAIREVRKANASSSTDSVEKTHSKEGSQAEESSPPIAIEVRRNGAELSKSKENEKPDVNISTSEDEVFSSPTVSQSKTLQTTDGNVQIDTISTHMRTSSESDVVVRSTKVLKTLQAKDMEITELDEITTKEKKSVRGSIITESDLTRRIGIKDMNGVEYVEEDLLLEKTCYSASKGEETVSVVNVSINKIQSPPVILQQLNDASGFDGESVLLCCKFESISDNDPISVVWMKDGVPVKSSKDIMMSWDPPTASLKILELLYPDDDGKYSCIATNSYGSAESSASVTVKENSNNEEPMFELELKNKEVSEGERNVTLVCKLKDKRDNASITWLKNSKPLTSSAAFLQSFDGQMAELCIAEVLSDDGGIYECVAEFNESRKSTSCTLLVTVTEEKDESSGKISNITPKTADEDDAVAKHKTEHHRNETGLNVQEDSNNNLKAKGEEKQEIDTSPTAPEALTVTNEDIPQSSTSLNQAKDEASAVQARNNINLSTNGSQSGLKAVLKQDLVMNRPTSGSAEKMVESIANKMAETGTAGNVSVKQAWSSRNSTGLKKETQSAADKSWGKPGPTSPAKGGKPGAPGGAKNAMAAFKQMDTNNNPNAGSVARPKKSGGQPSVVDGLLRWCQLMTKEYQNVKIDNFSSSWNDGVAFLALIHHFYPDSFDWGKVDPKRRRENFQLAFDLAEKKADIAPLLDVEDMVRMQKPDWKCVFTYIQSFYRKLRDHEKNQHQYLQQQQQATASS